MPEERIKIDKFIASFSGDSGFYRSGSNHSAALNRGRCCFSFWKGIAPKAAQAVITSILDIYKSVPAAFQNREQSADLFRLKGTCLIEQNLPGRVKYYFKKAFRLYKDIGAEKKAVELALIPLMEKVNISSFGINPQSGAALQPLQQNEAASLQQFPLSTALSTACLSVWSALELADTLQHRDGFTKEVESMLQYAESPGGKWECSPHSL